MSDRIHPKHLMTLLQASRGGAQLSIDGNCGCALLGENLQTGEAEFVEIDETEFGDGYEAAAKRATVRALRKLEKRCYPHGEASLPFCTSDHPLF